MPTDTARRPRLSERIRLIRILRTHGLRAVERLRADELRVALDKLGLTLNGDEEQPANVVPLRPSSSSSELLDASASSSTTAPPPEAPSEEPPDPMDPRFREPGPFLPSGERTFARVVAVDWHQLFVTWDLDGGARARLGGDDARLVVRAADRSRDDGAGASGDVLYSEPVRVSAGGWYLRAPEQRLRVVVTLTTPDGEVLAVSNACIVPPNHAAPPGPLRFATVPVHVDRRRLRGGLLLRALVDDETDLPEGVVVAESGRVVRSRLAHEEEESAPSSGGKRRLLSQGGPSLPASSSAPSSWRSAPSSSGAPR